MRSSFITIACVITLTAVTIASILLKQLEFGGLLLAVSIIGLFLVVREPTKPKKYVIISIPAAWIGVIFLGLENGVGGIIFGLIIALAVSYAGISLLRGKLPEFNSGKR